MKRASLIEAAPGNTAPCDAAAAGPTAWSWQELSDVVCSARPAPADRPAAHTEQVETALGEEPLQNPGGSLMLKVKHGPVACREPQNRVSDVVLLDSSDQDLPVQFSRFHRSSH
ncbi:hypothetical protein EYF80_030986 [Liparis tanakae]|uniref:Uncharacterized protein n=1 Tax=Liparis tanakae TaxID=230148 RepID=A0A4Z2GYW4_9TELE|nr:hypothetical protein EYF80_030986 [Liparis tanakae]